MANIFFIEKIEDLISECKLEELYFNSVDIEGIIDELNYIIAESDLHEYAKQEAVNRLKVLCDDGTINTEDYAYICSQLES